MILGHPLGKKWVSWGLTRNKLRRLPLTTIAAASSELRFLISIKQDPQLQFRQQETSCGACLNHESPENQPNIQNRCPPRKEVS